MTKAIVVLGGYGNFGYRIAAALAHEPNARILVVGRDQIKARQAATEIGGNAEPVALDHRSADFATQLIRYEATVLIHSAGPFQGQDYQVAQSCIEAGCHYVDIADGRGYVAGVGKLDASARAKNVLIVSGASSLPALSSAVVDQYRTQFSRIDSIEHAISSGAKPPGIATMQGVFGYVGKSFMRWDRNAWRTVFGWQDVVTHRFPSSVGRRWLVNCDVPDLELFPARYPGVQSVIFRAGIGFTSTMLVIWVLSWLVRAGLIKNLARYAKAMHRLALYLEPLGTQRSGMWVQVVGSDAMQRPLRRTWHLSADNNHGPNIPCFPAIALARKLLRDEVSERGAMPCMGLLSVDTILTAMPGFDLHVVESE
jgi:saccharopine dehydrogenase-like NADP-dependent oxidoreductase